MEEEAPQFKEDPKDAVALLQLIDKEQDPRKKGLVAKKLAADKDVAPVLAALQDMLTQVQPGAEDEIEEGIEQVYDDLTARGSAAALDMGTKISDFLDQSEAGQILKKSAGPLLGLALIAFVLQSPGEGGNLNKAADSITQLITNPNKIELANGMADVVADVMMENLKERKKN